MLTLFREGGYSMFFILGFGFVALAAAAAYAARGKKASLRFILAMMATTMFATVQGICSDFGATFHAVSGPLGDADPTQRLRILSEGLGESMAPGIMGFALLALAALLLAVGGGRVAKLEEAA
jgi:hypothetical protein